MTRSWSPPPPTGRTLDLQRLDEAMSGTRTGSGGVVLVGGEAGIGKSWLLGEFTARVRDTGGLVAAGTCLPVGDTALPLAPVVEIVANLHRHRDAAVRRVLANAAPELRALVPERGPTDPVGDGDNSQLRRLLGLRDLLDGLARLRPVAVVIEDAQWADTATRDALLYLASELAGPLPVLLVVAYRSDEVDRHHPLRPLLVELARRPHVRRLELAPLDPAATGEQMTAILGYRPDDGLVEDVQRRAQGNPFFTEQLTATLRDGEGGLPDELRDILLLRFERLDGPVQQLLRLIAAIGRPVDHATLEALTGDTHVELDGDLRAAIDGGQLTVDRDGRYELRHTLLGEAVDATLLPGERARLHHRIATHLAGLADPPAAELAHHWTRAGALREAVVASVPAAVQAAALGAHSEAHRHAERALALSAQLPDGDNLLGDDPVGFLVLAAESADASGDSARAVELVRRALPRVADDPVRAGRLHERLGRYAWHSGDAVAADGAYDEALRLVVPAGPSADAAVVLAAVAMHHVLQDRSHDALAHAEEAIEIARTVGDIATEAHARCSLGSALADLGQLTRGIAEITAARQVAGDLGRPQDVVRTGCNLCHALIQAGRYAEAVTEARAGRAYCREHGLQGAFAGAFVANEAEALWRAGRWDELWDLVIDGAIPSDRYGSQWANLTAAALLLARGDPERARRYVDASATFAGEDPQTDLYIELLRVRLAWAEGDGSAVVAALAGAAGRLRGGASAPMALEVVASGVAILADLATVADATHDDEAAARMRALGHQLAARGRAIAHDAAAVPEPLCEIAPLTATIAAQAARLHGQPDPAPWRAALAAWQAVPQPFAVGWSQLRLAEALVATGGDPQEIAALVTDANDTARRLEAAELGEEVALLARRARVTLPGRVGTPALHAVPVVDDDPTVLLGLTGRELEVLELVALGRTNAEIGRQLYITDKTASVHVSNILRKLGVGNRVEAAAVAHRVGLGREPTAGASA